MSSPESANDRPIPTNDRPITVSPEGDFGSASVVLDASGLHVSFHVDGGHLPMATRDHLVEAVFALPLVKPTLTLQASVPIGDTELLLALARRCTGLTTRPAGSTCLVEGVVA